VGASSLTDRTGRSVEKWAVRPVSAQKPPWSPPTYSYKWCLSHTWSTSSFNAATSTRVPSVPMVISTAGQRLPVRVMDIQGWFTVYTPNRGQRAPGVAWLVTDKQQMSPVCCSTSVHSWVSRHQQVSYSSWAAGVVTFILQDLWLGRP
jgi:hypothetical protein